MKKSFLKKPLYQHNKTNNRYCYFDWGCCGKTEINRLQRLQNKAIRMISGSSYDAPSKLLSKSLGSKAIKEIIGIQEQSNMTTRIQCHEINFQNRLNLRVY